MFCLISVSAEIRAGTIGRIQIPSIRADFDLAYEEMNMKCYRITYHFTWLQHPAEQVAYWFSPADDPDIVLQSFRFTICMNGNLSSEDLDIDNWEMVDTTWADYVAHIEFERTRE